MYIFMNENSGEIILSDTRPSRADVIVVSRTGERIYFIGVL